ncbi:hypothetical protein D3C72_1583750 [compost metagenome]
MLEVRLTKVAGDLEPALVPLGLRHGGFTLSGFGHQGPLGAPGDHLRQREAGASQGAEVHERGLDPRSVERPGIAGIRLSRFPAKPRSHEIRVLGVRPLQQGCKSQRSGRRSGGLRSGIRRPRGRSHAHGPRPQHERRHPQPQHRAKMALFEQSRRVGHAESFPWSRSGLSTNSLSIPRNGWGETAGKP